MAKRGRKPIVFSEKELLQMETLAAMGASNESIAQFLGCSEDTLSRNYADVLKKGKERLNNRIRLKQVQVALQGNVTMLIWLGKQLLNQTDKWKGGPIGDDGFEFYNPGGQ